MSPPTSAAREVERGGRGETRRDATTWPRVRLGDHADKIGSGLTPNGGHAAYVDEGIPLIRSQNVHMGRFDPSGLVHITPEQDEEMSGSRVQRGDVLLNITGASIGRVCVAPDHLVPANVNQHVCIIRSDGSWHPDFLGRFLSTPSFQRFILGDQAGATRQALTKAQIEDFRIPLPPLAEQERIAGRLTEQLGAVERARAAAAQRLAAAEALPAALLREVFDGPQASGWETRRIDEVCDLLPSKSIASDGDTEVRAITTACLTERGFRPEGIKTARMRAADVAVSTVRCGELLIARSNTPDLVGRASIYLGEPEGIVASDLTIRLWARGGEGGALPDYLAAYMSFLFQTGYWKERAGGASGSMKKITREQLSAEIVPVPDLPTQRRLAADLGEKLAAAEGVIARCREELAAIDALPASLLRDAFGGGREDEEQEGP